MSPTFSSPSHSPSIFLLSSTASFASLRLSHHLNKMQFFSKLLALAPLGFSLVAAVAVSSHHHYRKPSCSTKSIDQLRGQISAHLSVDATVDIVSKLCHSLTSQVTELSASADVDLSLQTVVDAEADLHLSVSVDVDVWAQLFVNLQFTLEAALK